MAKIGFLGLGEMGAAMGMRLLRAGQDLAVWNRSPERTVALAREGAAVAPSPAKAAAAADFVITMLATPEALEQVLFGTAGAGAPPLAWPGPDRHVDRGARRGPLGRRTVAKGRLFRRRARSRQRAPGLHPPS